MKVYVFPADVGDKRLIAERAVREAILEANRSWLEDLAEMLGDIRRDPSDRVVIDMTWKEGQTLKILNMRNPITEKITIELKKLEPGEVRVRPYQFTLRDEYL